MYIIKLISIAAILTCMCSACNQPETSQSETTGLYDSDAFKSYWYAGKAEVNAYNLDQSRYGENRPGKAILIFVTEAFSKSKHVKLDHPEAAGDDKVTVMKLNYTKNFVTGIYPYSMMLSVFTPVSRSQYPNTLKVTMGSQEWCGQVFSQMNLVNDRYDISGYSYFEQEGNTQFNTEKIFLEDELFNLIRLDPDHIPLGKIKILPGLFFTRLKHEDLKPVEATLSKENKDHETIYKVQFEERLLTISVANDFPYKILGWEEEFVEGGKKMYTKATLGKTLYTDYWSKNKNEYIFLRDSLGLSPTNY
ncbi:MAG: hypothetical protein KF860_09375 [Cyclobacteriaceae bacterium]|nr:hypothetical protein [Cyclobacteriaceae bacterium]